MVGLVSLLWVGVYRGRGGGELGWGGMGKTEWSGLLDIHSKEGRKEGRDGKDGTWRTGDVEKKEEPLLMKRDRLV